MADKILVVDNEPHMKSLLGDFLTGKGYHAYQQNIQTGNQELG